VDAGERFAAEATAYSEWAVRGTDTGQYAARNALLHITRLYLASLELPPAWSDELADPPDAQRVGDGERLSVCAAVRRLPLDCYAEVFDPLAEKPEEPVTRSLADDIADIYRDVVTGLRDYEAGRRAQAVWEWGFGLRHHWGEHATGAIRALHCWLAANAFDRLAADAE
jgi:hypothetical protein